jgi:DNA anti-recombination protein RmuC
MPKGEDLLKQLLEVEERLNTTLSEARGTLKDLRDERQRAVKYIATEPAKTVAKEVTAQLEEMGKQTEKAMHTSVDKVLKEFDKLREILLGTADDGEPDLFELAEAKVKRDKGE